MSAALRVPCAPVVLGVVLVVLGVPCVPFLLAEVLLEVLFVGMLVSRVAVACAVLVRALLIRAPVVGAGRVRKPSPGSLGTGVGSVMDCLQPFDGHMGVKLRCCERSVTKQLLDATKIGTTFEQMCRSRVTQTMRSHDGNTRNCVQRLVHDTSNAGGLEPAAACTQ